MLQRHVYGIIVATHDKGELVLDTKVVATSSEAAMAKLDIKEVCAQKGVTPDEIEYIICKYGSFRPIQEVETKGMTKF